MAKVLLIQPHNDREIGKPVPDATTPLSLIYVGTAIENKHPVKIYDRNLNLEDNHLINQIIEFNPNIIGLTSITTKMLLDLSYLIKLIKRVYPNITIVVGGIHATIEPDSILNENADYVIRGEGEDAFLEFCDTFDKDKRRLNQLKNINHNELRDYIDLNKLKLPNYSLIDLSKYERVYVSLSRGCYGNCTFCYSCKMWGKNNNPFIRSYSTERAIQLFKELIEKYKVNKISIADDNFVPFKSRAIEICNFLSNYKLNFFCFGRADYLNDEIMTALKKAGCHTIFIGGESGSQRVLDFINKKTKLEQTANAIKICKKYNIISDVSFMLGITTETLEELNMTKDFINKYKPDIPNVLIFNPMPGTPIYSYCLNNNLLTPAKNLEEWANWTGDMKNIKHNTSNVSDKELMKIFKELSKPKLGYKIKKFIYWIKAGEIKYALKGVLRNL